MKVLEILVFWIIAATLVSAAAVLYVSAFAIVIVMMLSPFILAYKFLVWIF